MTACFAGVDVGTGFSFPFAVFLAFFGGGSSALDHESESDDEEALRFSLLASPFTAGFALLAPRPEVVSSSLESLSEPEDDEDESGSFDLVLASASGVTSVPLSSLDPLLLVSSTSETSFVLFPLALSFSFSLSLAASIN